MRGRLTDRRTDASDSLAIPAGSGTVLVRDAEKKNQRGQRRHAGARGRSALGSTVVILGGAVLVVVLAGVLAVMLTKVLST